MKINNPYRFYSIFSFIVLLTSIPLFLYSHKEPMLIFFGVFLFLLGLIFGLISLLMYKIVNNTFMPENLIAAWEVVDEDWKNFCKGEISKIRFNRNSSIAALLIVAPISMYLYSDKDSLFLYIIALVLGITLFFIWYIFQLQIKNLKSKNSGQIIIVKSGALMNKRIHLWNFWGSRLSSLHYNSGNKCLDFSVSYNRLVGNRISSSYTFFSIPCSETNAKVVLNYFAKGIRNQDRTTTKEDITKGNCGTLLLFEDEDLTQDSPPNAV